MIFNITMEIYKSIKARDIISEDQLKLFLQDCGINSLSPKDAEWLSHWWEKEIFPNPPIARIISIRGNEGYNPALCFSVIEGKFNIFRFDEVNQWFDKLDESSEFQVYSLKGYLANLVNRDLENWRDWVKRQSKE